ncbi:helix-turn-helix domain-containing protein [Liquorilactobacillus satsumensis]|uniref:helix-turn-helix domain-containing protein n=1 Tax=Liquorilactobacillus satsumensis TaxID=259059 RepID=UPI001E4C4F8A|nr:Rgg/GadR/MutR family transcriptional regulator [Liquorilactobacillus satsumensis]MCC7666155.1 transcriptional regulator [Liquorilactobacillus satsumensis]MCP9313373.1 Rgg/GadR/MutR family transcriptional regulator [Liquorilactobacillus satsumensis]MCP9329164.1 Rgg/GadR/MutR family transcriptional regulator [Liquorilactobacillus satsumensis]MCP9357421.1 Rgg/GadR/MutR family transcriptional regulator [Liquorilactobacillus satsumensis]MCP9360069.1 Rgg/GadR/MutR family transcriptional regulator
MKTGELVKNIRTAKGIKAKTIYDDLLSRSMYYKYESGLVETTADTFLHILDRLNVGADEFMKLFGKFIKKDDHYRSCRNDLKQAFAQGNLTEIKAIEKKIEKEYNASHLLRLHNLAVIADAMKKTLGKTSESTLSERKEIMHYLSRSHKWGYYEYSLFSDAIFMFDSSSTEKLLQNHDWDTEAEVQDITLENLKIKTLCNAILLFMKANKKEHVAYYYNLLNKIKVDSSNVSALSNKTFFEGLKIINDGDYEQGLKIISDTFSLYQKLGLDDLYRQHVAILQELLSVNLQKAKSRRRRKA